jgi:transcription elongation factor Elf1
MPLSKTLFRVLLNHPCPHCGHMHENMGAWFKSIGHYGCKSCGQIVQMTYDDKIRLFEVNTHRMINPDI